MRPAGARSARRGGVGLRSHALALAATAAACVLHCASAFTLNAAAAAAAAAAPPAKTDPWAGGPPLWEMQWTAPNKTYVAPAPKGMAVTQLGKRRRYHGGKNVTFAPIAAELRQMGGLWTLDHDAVCNDGSTGYYYFKKGYNPGLWIMYLQGGPMCYDAASCAAMPTQYTSTVGAPHSVFLTGIFAATAPTKNIQFADANAVWVAYCTSDGWAGDLAPYSPNTTNYTAGETIPYAGFAGGFRGQRIINATLASMVKNLGFGTTDSTKLLFGGCTPGAIYNLDLVPEVLKSLGVKEDMVSVQGLFDSAAVLDIEPLSPTTMSLANMTAQAYEYVGAAWTANSACLADNGQEPWRCMLGSTLLPYVQTPYLLVQSKYDRAQLMYNAPHPGRGNASLAYADAFGAASAALFSTLPTSTQTRSALFASACFSFCTSLSAMFWNTAIDGVAPPKVLGATVPTKPPPPVSLETVVDWWFFKGMKNVRVFDDCDGFRCGQCKANLAAKDAKPRSKASKEFSALIGPILVGGFLLAVLLGCCLACAMNEPRRSGPVRRKPDETTPLTAQMTTQFISTRAPPPAASLR